MPHHYTVTPRLQRKRLFYIAKSYNATGNRVCCGLETEDMSHAGVIYDGLVALHNARATGLLRPTRIHRPSRRRAGDVLPFLTFSR